VQLLPVPAFATALLLLTSPSYQVAPSLICSNLRHEVGSRLRGGSLPPGRFIVGHFVIPLFFFFFFPVIFFFCRELLVGMIIIG